MEKPEQVSQGIRDIDKELNDIIKEVLNMRGDISLKLKFVYALLADHYDDISKQTTLNRLM